MQVSVLQLRDPIFANDDGFQTIDAKTVLYVTGIRHRFEVNGRATTEIETTSYPDYPAFEPRDDISADTINTVFHGQPVVNVAMS